MTQDNGCTSWLVAGDSWTWKALGAAVLAAFFFSCAPALFFHPDVVLPPAYRLKAQQPLADTTQLTIPPHAGERSHGAKLTPRLFGAYCLHIAVNLGWHPYMPATLGGLLFLFAGLRVGAGITRDRMTGLYLSLTFAGLYAASACFAVNWQPKPYDGIVMGLIGLAMLSLNRPLWLGAAAFLCGWTDERAILSMGFIGLLAVVAGEPDRGTIRRRWVAIAAGLAAFILSRVVVAKLVQWGAPDFSMMNFRVERVVFYFPYTAWTCFEGGWAVILVALGCLWRGRDHLLLGFFAAAVLGSVVVCLTVLDISRAACFAVPLIPAGYAILAKRVPPGELRRLAGVGAAISLISPNAEIIVDVVIKWLPATLPAIFAL